ncbi:hypothetical protein N9B24_03000, partial [bacterium]|nr:hypothetical protein [bacterium]
MQKTCFYRIPALLCTITLCLLSGCDREPKSPQTETPVSPANPSLAVPSQMQLPEDAEKVAALEAAGFTLTRDSRGLVTELTIVSDEPI